MCVLQTEQLWNDFVRLFVLPAYQVPDTDLVTVVHPDGCNVLSVPAEGDAHYGSLEDPLTSELVEGFACIDVPNVEHRGVAHLTARGPRRLLYSFSPLIGFKDCEARNVVIVFPEECLTVGGDIVNDAHCGNGVHKTVVAVGSEMIRTRGLVLMGHVSRVYIII